MKHLSILFYILFSLPFLSLAQEVEGEFSCTMEEPDEDYYRNLEAIFRVPQERGMSTMKLVRVNIHYMLRTDGTGNFTETGDNLGGTRTGYDFANDLIKKCNEMLSWNPKMNLPPNNTTDNPPQNYRYVLDDVYFHRDDNLYTYDQTSTQYNAVKTKGDSVVNIIFTHGTQYNSPYGHAGDLSENSKVKYTDIASVYKKYTLDSYSDVVFVTTRTVIHEIGHNLGLKHTVRYGGSCPCQTATIPGPSSKSICLSYYLSNTINYSCGDAIPDTPTAWDLTDNLGSPIHPACGWVLGASSWCSNNMMDYGMGHALTPQQLQVTHNYLEGGMSSYTVCDALEKDEFICEFTFPKENYFGKNVKVKACNPISNKINLISNERATIYFKESTEFYPGFEVEGITGNLDHSKFEVIQENNCY